MAKAKKNKSAAILDPGFSLRTAHGITGFVCAKCRHFQRVPALSGGCANCGEKALQEVKTRDRAKQETEWALDKQRWKQGDKFNPYDKESQKGRQLTGPQVIKLLQKFIPGVQGFMGWNHHYQKPLYNLYVPFRGTELDKQNLSDFQQKHNLQLVCCCEVGMMPEWDILSRDEKGLPVANASRQRGWRSVVATFGRLGLMPFLEDDGRRKSAWELKNSPIKEHKF